MNKLRNQRKDTMTSTAFVTTADELRQKAAADGVSAADACGFAQAALLLTQAAANLDGLTQGDR